VNRPPRVVGRYALYGAIAAGGMAQVHLGRLLGPSGFARTVAIKRLHDGYATDPEFCAMFLEEARLAARVHHPNVVQTLDVALIDGELLLVMDYVPGESLSRIASLLGDARRIPPRICASVIAGALLGLHAAHVATDELNEPLCIVHRDVSPQNVLVGQDGVARVLDFGIAKARRRTRRTRGGVVQGKAHYLAPEQLSARDVDARTDVYAAGVVLWECLTGERLVLEAEEYAAMAAVQAGPRCSPRAIVPEILEELDRVTMRALARDPDDRFGTAREMARALERCIEPATASEVAEWLEGIASASLRERARRVAEVEAHDVIGAAPPSADPDPLGEAPTRELARPEPDEAPPPAVEAPPRRPRAWRRRAATLAAALVVFVGAAFALTRRPAHAPPPPPIPTATAAAPPEDVAFAPVVTAPSSSEAPPPPPPRRAPPPARPRASCDPPYVIDERGIRHLRRECLQ
jgi:serine/threonine-protein kinase